MFIKIQKKRASSIAEYLALIIIIISALIAFKPYLTRALNGNWKKSGDTFGMSRRFNAKTVECDYAQLTATDGIWYDANCYMQSLVELKCSPGSTACENDAKANCQTTFCTQH